MNCSLLHQMLQELKPIEKVKLSQNAKEQKGFSSQLFYIMDNCTIIFKYEWIMALSKTAPMQYIQICLSSCHLSPIPAVYKKQLIKRLCRFAMFSAAQSFFFKKRQVLLWATFNCSQIICDWIQQINLCVLIQKVSLERNQILGWGKYKYFASSHPDSYENTLAEH